MGLTVSSVLPSAVFTDSASGVSVNSVYDTSAETMALRALFHHSFKPEDGYYLRLKPHMTWAAFVNMLDKGDNDMECAAWTACSLCRRTWEYMSTLSDIYGQQVIFRDSLTVYPEFAWKAITAFKESFRFTPYSDNIVFYPPDHITDDGVNFGREQSGGHIHLYFESNLEVLNNEQVALANTYQRAIRMGLEHLERTANHPKSRWSAEFFAKAADSNYGGFTDAIVRFCSNMSQKMHLIEQNARMLRPSLIAELEIMCFASSEVTSEDELNERIFHIIKLFRRRAAIDYSVREVIFRNFILNSQAEKSTFKWPTKSSFSERLVAIALQNALYKDKDAHLACLMLNVPYDNDQPRQNKRHALGLALRAYINNEPINLGTNQHRLQVLYYNIIGNWKSMPGLTTTESCSILFIDDDELELAGEVLAGFLGTPLGVNQTETMFKALKEFTSKNKTTITLTE
jgi:hypothetical protein